jgi:hypothetical protein
VSQNGSGPTSTAVVEDGTRKFDQLGSSIASKDSRHQPFRQGRFQRTAPPVAAQSRQCRGDAAWGTALEEFGSARGNGLSLSSIRYRRQYESFRDRRPNWRSQS